MFDPLSNLSNPACNSGEPLTNWLIPDVTLLDTPFKVCKDVLRVFNPVKTPVVSASIVLLYAALSVAVFFPNVVICSSNLAISVCNSVFVSPSSIVLTVVSNAFLVAFKLATEVSVAVPNFVKVLAVSESLDVDAVKVSILFSTAVSILEIPPSIALDKLELPSAIFLVFSFTEDIPSFILE